MRKVLRAVSNMITITFAHIQLRGHAIWGHLLFMYFCFMWRWFKSVTLLLAGAILLLHNLLPHCHDHLPSSAVHERMDLPSHQMEEIWHLLVINDMQEGHLEDFYPTHGVSNISVDFLKSDACNESLHLLKGHIFHFMPVRITHILSEVMLQVAGRAPPLI